MATEESPGSEPAQGAAAGAPAAAAPIADAGGGGQGATAAPPLGESPASVSGRGRDAFDERPEVFVGGAFVGGFAVAMILKRVVR